jgi:hypothetical protein
MTTECPKHGPMLPVRGADHMRIVAYVCTACAWTVAASEAERNATMPVGRATLPGDAPDPLAALSEPADAYDGPEKALVEEARKWCIANGCRLWRVGQRKAKRAGNEVGIPDTFVRRNEWPVGVWKAVEIKTKGVQLSPAQRLNVEMGLSYAAWNLRQVIEALCAEGGQGR